MMKTIDRYIMGELAVSFALSLVALNFVLVTEKFIRLTRVISNVGLGAADMFYIILYLQPIFSVLSIPMALFVAVLITYGRLDADSEIIVLRTGGMSFASLARPVFVFGTICFTASLIASAYVSPASSKALRSLMVEIIKKRSPAIIEEGVFNSSFPGILIYVKEKTSDSSYKGVFIRDARSSALPTVLYAKSADVALSGHDSVGFDLRDGSISFAGEGTMTGVEFKRYLLSVPVPLDKVQMKLNEYTPRELFAEARTMSGKDMLERMVEFHRRITFPALCLVLMVLGAPLSLWAGKGGRLSGLATGFMVFAAYYSALVYFEGMVMAGALPHYIGAWIPVAALGALALYLFRREAAK